jgi:hypothetical protein
MKFKTKEQFIWDDTIHTLILSVKVNYNKELCLYKLAYPNNEETIIGYHIGFWNPKSYLTTRYVHLNFNFIKSAYTFEAAKKIFQNVLNSQSVVSAREA